MQAWTEGLGVHVFSTCFKTWKKKIALTTYAFRFTMGNVTINVNNMSVHFIIPKQVRKNVSITMKTILFLSYLLIGKSHGDNTYCDKVIHLGHSIPCSIIYVTNIYQSTLHIE